MANTYLDKKGGANFWPDDKDAPNHNSLQYSVDHKLYVEPTLIEIRVY